MAGLLNVYSISISHKLILQTQAHLRRMGKLGFEGIALWAGINENGSFDVSQTLIPVQTPLRLSSGVCYFVDAEELHHINVWLYENGLTIIAQIHSHPEEAFHSSTDDTFPIATSLGSLSLVVPNFARQPFQLINCAVFRLLNNGWIRLPNNEVKQLIIIKG